MGTWLVPAAPPPFASMLQVLAHRSPNAPPTRNACVRLHCAVTEKQAIQTSVSVTTPHCITPRNSAQLCTTRHGASIYAFVLLLTVHTQHSRGSASTQTAQTALHATMQVSLYVVVQ